MSTCSWAGSQSAALPSGQSEMIMSERSMPSQSRIVHCPNYKVNTLTLSDYDTVTRIGAAVYIVYIGFAG